MWGITLDEILFEACSVAEIFKYDQIEPEHVIFALLSYPELRERQELCGIDPDEVAITLEAGFRHWRKHQGVAIPRLIISDELMRVLGANQDHGAPLLRGLLRAISDRAAGPRKRSPIPDPLPDLDEILDAVAEEEELFGFDRICDDVFPGRKGGQNPNSPGGAIESDAQVRSEPKPKGSSGAAPEKPSLSGKERQEAKRAVERSIRDLTALYFSGQLDPVIGRDAEIDQICRILMRRRKSNVLLVGEPGVGKTALMEGVAARIATSHDPALSRRPVLQASLGALVAGARYRGDFEIRMELLVEQALQRGAVLFFDEMQMLVGSGATAERGMDGANLLKPVLARDGMSLVGATTNEEAASIRADPALMRRFEAVMVREPDPDLMREIMRGSAEPYLKHHQVSADSRFLGRLIDFADRYLPDRRFPDKAFDLLDTACVHARMSARTRLRVDDLRFATRQLGGTLPSAEAGSREERGRAEEELISQLANHVGGHPEALSRTASAVLSGGPARPVLAQLVGPSGVGRRTLARALSRALGGPLLELDAGAGPDRVRSGIWSGLMPGVRAVILINVPEGMETETVGLLKGVTSSGVLPGENGRQIDMTGSVILLRVSSERKRVGFTNENEYNLFHMNSIESINMGPFSNETLRDAVRFELERLSRIWSDSGVSRPIPEVDSVICGIQGAVRTWAEVTRLCANAARKS